MFTNLGRLPFKTFIETIGITKTKDPVFNILSKVLHSGDLAFLISRPSALTRRIVIKWKLCSNDENSHPFMRDLHIVFYLPCQGMKIIFRYPNYVIHTLPRGGGTAFPISLCLSRIVPANSKSSLKVIQVVKCKKLVSVVQNCKTVLLSPC